MASRLSRLNYYPTVISHPRCQDASKSHELYGEETFRR
jgi:hypothetical protein